MSQQSRLTVRSQASPTLRASKWLTSPVLMDTDEMKEFIYALKSFWIFPLGGLVAKDKEEITKEEFLAVYDGYISLLKSGLKPDDHQIRRCFYSVWTTALDHLYAVSVSDTHELIKIDKPVVHLQHHTCDYSSADEKFRSMVYGVESISWGIQFSYPQLYQNEQMATLQVNDSKEFPNTAFFREIQRWIRYNTVPAPFIIDGKQLNVPIRLGKKCLNWINSHPQLIQKKMAIKVKE